MATSNNDSLPTDEEMDEFLKVFEDLAIGIDKIVQDQTSNKEEKQNGE